LIYENAKNPKILISAGGMAKTAGLRLTRNLMAWCCSNIVPARSTSKKRH